MAATIAKLLGSFYEKIFYSFQNECSPFLFVFVFRVVLDNPILEKLLGVLVLGRKCHLDSKHHQSSLYRPDGLDFDQVGPCLSLSYP